MASNLMNGPWKTMNKHKYLYKKLDFTFVFRIFFRWTPGGEKTKKSGPSNMFGIT